MKESADEAKAVRKTEHKRLEAKKELKVWRYRLEPG
jgi:hypothetical protein